MGPEAPGSGSPGLEDIMRHLRWILVPLLLLVASSAWAHDAKMQAELLDEVLRLTHAQVPDQLILDQIDAWGYAFELTADDIVELRTLGVSDSVIHALIGTAGYEASELSVSRTHVYLSAGFYSPWYYYPYAWAGYCDPFPRLYASFYYPFYYGVGFGYYGWCGSTYYAYYHPRAAHHQGRWGRRGVGPHPSPYTVASHRGSRPAGSAVVPGSSRSRSASPAVSPRVIRGSRSANGISSTLRRGTQLRTPSSSLPARRAPARSVSRSDLQRGRGGSHATVLQPRSSRGVSRVPTPSWQHRSSGARSVDRALSRRGSWSVPRASQSRPAFSPSRSSSRFTPSFRMQSAPRAPSMSRGAPSSVGARFGAARSR